MKAKMPFYTKVGGFVYPYQTPIILKFEGEDYNDIMSQYKLFCAEYDHDDIPVEVQGHMLIGQQKDTNTNLNASKPVDYSKTQTTNSDSSLNTEHGSAPKKEYPTPTDPGKDEHGDRPSESQIRLLTDLTNPSCFKFYGEGKLDQKVGWDRNEFMTQYQKKHEAFSMNALTKKQVMYLIDTLFKMKGGN